MNDGSLSRVICTAKTGFNLIIPPGYCTYIEASKKKSIPKRRVREEGVRIFHAKKAQMPNKESIAKKASNNEDVPCVVIFTTAGSAIAAITIRTIRAGKIIQFATNHQNRKLSSFVLDFFMCLYKIIIQLQSIVS